MNSVPEAISITLRSRKPLAPSFHRHIAKSKLMNRTCQIGEQVIIYEIIKTEPKGPVLVTNVTHFEFE